MHHELGGLLGCHGTRYVPPTPEAGARAPYVQCVTLGAGRPARPVRTQRGRLVRVARTYPTEAPGRTRQLRSAPARARARARRRRRRSPRTSRRRCTCERVGAQIRSLGRTTGGLAGGFEGAGATAQEERKRPGPWLWQGWPRGVAAGEGGRRVNRLEGTRLKSMKK